MRSSILFIYIIFITIHASLGFYILSYKIIQCFPCLPLYVIETLFDIPILMGILITITDVFLILFLQKKGFRVLESIVLALLIVIVLCFAFELILAKPDFYSIVNGLIPQQSIFSDERQLYVAIGILGATVMPHNLYLHSSIVQTRAFAKTDEDRTKAIKFATIDSTISLGLAFFINAGILILAASTFYFSGNRGVAEIQDAHKLLNPGAFFSISSPILSRAFLY